MVFEFQAWITREIETVRTQVSKDLGFTFIGKNQANELGHIAGMVNQMKNVLFDIRTIALGYQTKWNNGSTGQLELRKCLYCGVVWTKVWGCDGATYCGQKHSGAENIDASHYKFATYSFNYNENATTDDAILTVVKNGERNFSRDERVGNTTMWGAGCGRAISWGTMTPHPVPPEFQFTQTVSTDDIILVKEEHSQSWAQYFDGMKSNLHVDVKPVI